MLLTPKISVIVPVSKDTKYLDKCIKSLLYQTYRNIEIICAINTSCVDTINFAEEYKKDERFKMFVIDGNFGELINLGISESTGDYISIINPNDWVLLTLYKTFVQTLEQTNKNIDVFIFKSASYKKGKNDVNRSVNYDITHWKNHNSDLTIHTLYDCIKPFSDRLMICNKIYRKEFLTEHSINFCHNLAYEEQIFTIKALIFANTITVSNKMLYRHRSEFEPIVLTEDVFDIFETIKIIKKEFKQNSNYEYFKYAIFQHEFMMYTILYKFCAEHRKDEYYNTIRQALIESESQNLDPAIFINLRNYQIVNMIKNNPRDFMDDIVIELH